ncbi:MAG: aminoacyl-tRNA hydrolase [Candidatus Saccharimonadales bacterium]
MKLIFAQGNPEPDYTKTRHNIGFEVVNTLAEKLDAGWTKKPKFDAIIAEVRIGNDKVLLAKPMTYYNETGKAARKLVDFYKLDPTKDLLVVHDDLALPFGSIRVRGQGSDAGNNGIKSLNSHLGHHYTRIRVGILNEFRDKMGDTNFVVSNFRNAETRQLKKSIIPQTIEIINEFCTGATKHTSYKVS